MLKNNPNSLNELVEKSKKAFLASPGVTKVNMYGSIESHKADNYSDLDLEVTSNRPEATVNGLISTLEKIGQPYVIMPISITKTERVFTIVWKKHSFYKKMDLRLLFSSPFPLTRGLTSYDESLRKFHSFFVGAIRYTKYRKRKMHWSSYKFYKASIEMWVELQTRELNLNSFIKLDESNLSRFTKWLYPKGYNDMDKYMIDIAKFFLKSITSDIEFGQSVIKFMRVELRV
jgi:predicted nucleotidyltransferase